MASEPTADRETATLLSYLDAQREHVLDITDGLDDAALRRAMLPSGWSCLGVIQHLALDVERFWFRAVLAGEQAVIEQAGESGDNAWIVPSDVTAREVFDLYRHEIRRANAIISATPIDAAPAWWPRELFGDWRLGDLREIMLHVIVETACHAGHLDAARELIDGRQWLVLTG